MKAPLDNTQESQKETVQKVQQEPDTGGKATITDNRPYTVIQRKLRSAMSGADDTENPIQRKNNTGLPDKLKAGVENLSGYSMDDVKVHYNSSKPAQLQAHAYAQGTDIHLAPGQEKHLPHEAWHVVQQKEGRVKPTRQLKSKVNVNDDAGLEKEADVMGQKAISLKKESPQFLKQKETSVSIQRKVIQKQDSLELNSEFDFGIEGTGEFNVPEFIKYQIEMAKEENDPEEFVTMGPEFEFAKVDPGKGKDLPIHEELFTSSEKVSGLPFVFETDAGNVIEAAFPPFIIGKVGESFEVLAYRAMRITSQIEIYLKDLAETLASQDRTLDNLKTELARNFDITLTALDDYADYANMPLLRFTKGIGMFTNEFISRDEVTNAQINITMSLDDIGEALKGATETQRGKEHMERKNAATNWIGDHLDTDNEQYVNILGYYISQIPLMALQNLMVKAREGNSDRDLFRNSSSTNQDLLTKLSSIKDFMGFWIKAGLNDLMSADSDLKELVQNIQNGDLSKYLLEDTEFNKNSLWEEHGQALAKFAREQGVDGINRNAFEAMVKKIVNTLILMAHSTTEPTATKSIDIPPNNEKGQDKDSYTKFSRGADQDGKAAPFMARPDTHVSVPGNRFLVEVRGLNKGVLSNENMQMFYMPGFRIENEKKDWEFTNYFQTSKEEVDNNGYRTFPAKIGRENKVVKVAYNYDDGLTIKDESEKIIKKYKRKDLVKLDRSKVKIAKGQEFEEYPTVKFGSKSIKIHQSKVDRFITFVRESIYRAWANKKFSYGKAGEQFRIKCESNSLRIELKEGGNWVLKLEKKGIDKSYAKGINWPIKFNGMYTTITFPNTDFSITTSAWNAYNFYSFILKRLED